MGRNLCFIKQPENPLDHRRIVPWVRQTLARVRGQIIRLGDYAGVLWERGATEKASSAQPESNPQFMKAIGSMDDRLFTMNKLPPLE